MSGWFRTLSRALTRQGQQSYLFCRCVLLCRVCLTDRMGQLVCTGRIFEAAFDILAALFDPVHGHAFNKGWDCLQIAVTAAIKFYI